MDSIRVVRTIACIAALLARNASAEPAQQPGQQPAPGPAKVTVAVPPEVLADFQARVNAYASLHKRLAATLPKLPKEATPQQVDRDQRAIAKLVAKERHEAKRGDLFTPGMQTFVRDLLRELFKGEPGAQVRKEVHDEPHFVKVVINRRYPDEVPLSTMPPQLLASLPKLPDELEFRFVNNDLILMDVHSHIVLDFVSNAMSAAPARPRKP